MDGGGFEPPKQFAADLQSVPFGHSGIHPLWKYKIFKKPMIGLEPITCWLQISCSANWATSAYYTAQLICNQAALPTIVSLHSTIVMNWATSAYTISAHIIVQMIFIRNQSVPFTTYYIVSLTTRQLKYNTSDSDGNRTRVTAVKGRCLNRLTTEPYIIYQCW